MKLTQSAVKDFDGCPRRWQSYWFEGIKPRPNEDMQAGLVFESLCLGSSADGSTSTELRRLESGQKSIRQVRIERQAKKFKELFNPDHPDFLGHEIIDKQLELKHGNRKGTIDFTTEGAIWDLKLTQDLRNGYWGDLSKVDFIQQVHYRELYYQNYGFYPDCYLIIFDTTPKENRKIIKLEVSDKAVKECEHRFDVVETMIDEYLTLPEFPRIPHPEQCVKCLIDCELRVLKPVIEYEEYEI